MGQFVLDKAEQHRDCINHSACVFLDENKGSKQAYVASNKRVKLNKKSPVLTEYFNLFSNLNQSFQTRK